MKKFPILLILFFFQLVYIQAQNSQYERDLFYTKILGSWDFAAIRDSPPMEWDFSWGKGEVIREMSVIIDWGFLKKPEDAFFFFTGSGSFIIESYEKISESLFKLVVVKKHNNDKSNILVHLNTNKEIWFEDPEEYNYRMGYSDEVEYVRGSIIHQLRLGEDNIYYRRSSPQIGILNASRVRIRRKPSLDGENLGYLEKDQIVYILNKTDEKMIIGEMESVWYKIKTLEGIEGWTYGFFIELESGDNYSK